MTEAERTAISARYVWVFVAVALIALRLLFGEEVLRRDAVFYGVFVGLGLLIHIGLTLDRIEQRMRDRDDAGLRRVAAAEATANCQTNAIFEKLNQKARDQAAFEDELAAEPTEPAPSTGPHQLP